MNTLREEGNDRNIFVSLIVNNAGTYTAAVTRKITCTKTISREFSYEFFGEGEKSSSDTQMVQSTEIEWFNLIIDKEDSLNRFDTLNARISELQKIKKESLSSGKYIPVQGELPFSSEKPCNMTSSKDKIIQQSKEELPKTSNYKQDFEDFNDSPYGALTEEQIDKEILDTLVLQVITGCVFISKGVDKDKWIKSMEKVYSKRFTDFNEFSNWAEFFIDFLMDDVVFNDKDFSKRGFRGDEIQAIYAMNLYEELSKIEDNRYITEFLSSLERYFV